MRVILSDTRQKKDKNDHIQKQLEALGYQVDRSKLYVGDYVFADSSKIAVDTKQDLQEVAGNLCQDHERFKQECERAKAAGVQLVILVCEDCIKSLEDVPSWFNWRKKFSTRAISGKQLWKIMTTMTERYGVVWKFSTRAKLGATIVELLEGDAID